MGFASLYPSYVGSNVSTGERAMRVHPASRWRAAAFGSAIGGVVLMAGADVVRAQEPTREEIIESTRAKQLSRCPRFDAKAGCGVAQRAGGIDVEVRFGRGSAMLGAAAVSQLQALGADLGKPELKGATLLVAGHTDASGSDAYNQRLSERRAGAVKRFLVARFNVPDDTVIAVGRGKAQPKNAADPYAGVNRRVQVALLPPGGNPGDAPDRR
jgi:outer membrane protein OmpA-like peptidoglycan-associated protein